MIFKCKVIYVFDILVFLVNFNMFYVIVVNGRVFFVYNNKFVWVLGNSGKIEVVVDVGKIVFLFLNSDVYFFYCI